jgi:hypothetical protein
MIKIPYTTNQSNPTIKAYKEAVEKGKRDQHVLPRENGWVVKNLLSDDVGKAFGTQHEAVKYAESNANQGTAVFVHAQNGLITQRKDY